MMRLENTSGPPSYVLENGANGVEWEVSIGTIASPPLNNDFIISKVGSGSVEFGITAAGDVFVQGSQVHLDYVFEPDYPLMLLEDLKTFINRERHLPNVPSAEEINKNGLNLTQFQMRLLEKIEELTLYAVEQHIRFDKLKKQNEALAETSNYLGKRLRTLEQQIASLQ